MTMIWYINDYTKLPTWVCIYVCDWIEEFLWILDEEKTTWIHATIDY